MFRIWIAGAALTLAITIPAARNSGVYRMY
jgi:hypothetical protein